MNSDFHVTLQPDGTYRFAKNCQLITQDGNNYTVKDCLGNTHVFTINTRYINVGLGPPSNTYTYDSPPTPIGFISFPDKLIIFSTNNVTGGYGEIGMISYTSYGQGIKPLDLSPNLHSGYRVLYHHASLNFALSNRIEGFAYQENDTIARVYWTDNLNQMRVFDIFNPIYTTYIASGSLLFNTEYMVLEGIVEYPVGTGNYYGPSTGAGNVLGNLFTTDGTHNTYTNITGGTNTKVISYYAYQLLSFTPDRSLGNIQFDSYGSGHKICGNKIYFYRQVSTADGYYTPFSYGSAPIHVGMPNNSVSPPQSITSGYEYFVGAGGALGSSDSGLSVKVTIDNLDQIYDTIQLVCAEYNTNNTTPDSITIVYNGLITGNSMTIEDTGTVNLGTITLAQLTLFPASILKCKTMATDKNYILIANTTERSELDVNNDFSQGVTLSAFQYPMISWGDDDGTASGTKNYCVNMQFHQEMLPSSTGNPPTTGIMPHSRYVVVSGGTVTYNAVTYSANQVFVGVAGVNTYTVSGSPVIRPVATQNRYTATNVGGTPRRENYNIIKGNGSTIVGYWDYKDPLIHQKCTGYWSTEKYRFGVLFFDLKGNPFYVRWIGDYTFPALSTKGGPLIKDNYNGTNIYSLNPSGLNVSGLKIPADMVAQISGFSIVRCERDPVVLHQGLMMQICGDGLSPETFYPISSVAGADSKYAMANPYLSYLSADKFVNYNLSKTGAVGDTLMEAGWVAPYNFAGAVHAGWHNRWQVTSKLVEANYGSLSNPNTRAATVTLIKGYPENTSDTAFDAGGRKFSNTIHCGGAGCAIDNTCSGSGNNFQNAEASGGIKTVVGVSSGATMPNYDGTTVYTQDAYSSYNAYKMLMNWTKPNSSQYGGNSPSAIANSLFISTGHYQPINSSVISDVADVNGNLIFNNIEVFGGDCFTCLVDQAYGLWDNGYTQSYSYSLFWPQECNANYNLRRGRKVVNDSAFTGGYTAVNHGIAWNDGLSSPPVRLEDYSYNPSYSADGNFIQYPALPIDFKNAGRFSFRARFAGQKFPGEGINTFRVFLQNDYHDMNGQYGEINNIKITKDNVVVWQNAGTSTVPILERQLLGSTSGAATTIGTGGVLTRHDAISSYHGNQHQWGLVETEYGFAWFDMRNKAFCTLDFTQGLVEISKVLGMASFFSEAFLEAVGVNISTNLLNDPTYAATSDQPLLGVGITGVYEPKFKMTYLTFKFFQTVVGGTSTTWTSQDFTIMYYHSDKIFIGFSDCVPAIWHNHNGNILAANNPKNLVYYGSNMTSTTFVPGNVVMYNGAEYVCYKQVTIASYPGAGTQIPNYLGSQYWKLMNSPDQIWVQNQPALLGQNTAPDYLYNSFFGRVVDNFLTFVVNPQNVPSAFSVKHVEQVGINVNWTDITYTAGNQSAADNAIQPTSLDYEYIDDRMCGNIPISTTGEIVNNHIVVQGVKHNWTTDPTTQSTLVKILQRFVSWFEFKR
jgi:hypothetical protein